MNDLSSSNHPEPLPGWIKAVVFIVAVGFLVHIKDSVKDSINKSKSVETTSIQYTQESVKSYYTLNVFETVSDSNTFSTLNEDDILYNFEGSSEITLESNDKITIDFNHMCKDVISVNSGIDCHVVKFKIKPKLNERQTVLAAFYDAENIIKNDLFKSKYYEDINSVQFWAVTDFENGKEQKFIQFTMSKGLIEKINDDEYMTPIDYDLYVEDLWLAFARDSLK